MRTFNSIINPSNNIEQSKSLPNLNPQDNQED